MTKMVKNILIINIVVFIIQLLVINNYPNFPWFEILALWPTETDILNITQWITHMFLHANLLHIVINMIVFISFGPIVENYLGKKFLNLYLLAGIVGALLHIIVTGSTNPMVGASGAIFGVFAATMLIDPDMKVYLFFIIGLKIKWIVPIILISELFSAFTTVDNVAHYAHIGGALMGFIYITYFKYLKKNEING
jgi:membrane associated rhomboid family serine protease